MAEFRKMTMGEVAEVAGLPKETLRARINRGVVEARKSPGWARFNLPSVVKICVHAEMMRRVGIEEVAIKAADFISESVHDFCKRPPYRIKRQGLIDGNYLFFRRDDHGFWHMFRADSLENAMQKLGSYAFDSQYLEASGFYFLNASTIADWVLDRIFDIQGIDGNEAVARK